MHKNEKEILQLFSSDLTCKQISEKLHIDRHIVSSIFSSHFGRENCLQRTKRLRSGNNNHMYGKSKELSPVWGRKISEEEFEKRSKALKGKIKGRVSPRKGTTISEESKQKIRKATQKQYLENKFKFEDTLPERIIKTFLLEINSNPAIQYIPIDEISEWPYGPVDFAFPDKKMVIEVLGDYWHGNPEKYPVLSDKQKKRYEKDLHRKKILKLNQWMVLEIWEDDIYNNIDQVKNDIQSFLKGNQIQNKKINSNILTQIESDDFLLEKIKNTLIETKSYAKTDKILNINRRILAFLNRKYNFIITKNTPIVIYKCFCEYRHVMNKMVKHLYEEHRPVVDKMIQLYNKYNIGVVIGYSLLKESLIKEIVKQYGLRKTHVEAMQVRRKPSVSNIESGAGVQKGQATQYAIHHPNPELAKHEQMRKELRMTKEDYMKHLNVDSQFLRRLSRGYETRKVKPTRFNVDHPNPEYAMHERQRQELNLTQEEYIEYLGVDDTFLRRLKNQNIEYNEKQKTKKEQQKEMLDKKNQEKDDWKNIESEIIKLFDSDKSARSIANILGVSLNTVIRTWERNLSIEDVKSRNSIRRLPKISFETKKDNYLNTLRERVGQEKIDALVRIFHEDIPISDVEIKFCETRKVIIKIWSFFYSSEDMINRSKLMQNRYRTRNLS